MQLAWKTLILTCIKYNQNYFNHSLLFFQSQNNVAQTRRNLATAVTGLIHSGIVAIGGVIYLGVAAATKLSNAGQVTLQLCNSLL